MFQLVKLLMSEKWRFMGLLLVLVAIIVISLAPVHLTRLAVDNAIANDDLDLLLVYCGVLLALLACKELLTYVQMVGFAKLGQNVMQKIRNKLFEKYVRAGTGFYAHYDTGTLITRTTTDVSTFERFLTNDVLGGLIPEAFEVISRSDLRGLATKRSKILEAARRFNLARLLVSTNRQGRYLYLEKRTIEAFQESRDIGDQIQALDDEIASLLALTHAAAAEEAARRSGWTVAVLVMVNVVGIVGVWAEVVGVVDNPSDIVAWSPSRIALIAIAGLVCVGLTVSVALAVSLLKRLQR